jgi:hypothetical protein
VDTFSWVLAHMWSMIILVSIALGGLKVLIDKM